MTTASPITIEELCRRLNVSVPEQLRNRKLYGVSTLEAATEKEAAYLLSDKFLEGARHSKAGVILAPQGAELDHQSVLHLDHVMEGVVTLLEHFHPDPAASEFFHPSAVKAESAQLGKDVYVGENVAIQEGARIGDRVRLEAGVVVGPDCTIGNDTRISPGVTLLQGSEIGERVRLHSGIVIGADGFRLEVIKGRLRKVPQVGRVVIEDDVEIGANSTVDRASLEITRIGARTKIDNMVHIGHNVQIGSDCVIVAQVGIGGSTKIGRGAMIAGGVAIKDHLVVGDGAKIGGRSSLQHDVPPGGQVMGSPAVPVKDYARFVIFYRNFSEYWKKLKPLLARVQETEKEKGNTSS